jgi:hypothetical protein
MKRLTQLALACMIALSMVPLVAAQEAAQPVVRLGDWVEIGPEAFMNIIATSDFRYRTTQNYDFEDRIQDRVPERDPNSTLTQDQECDCMWIEARIGADFRYQKNLQFQILFEHQTFQDGNLSDGRSVNDNNPGGTDIFGRGAESEGEAVNLERVWLDYQFPGTPVNIRVGFDLWALDQARFIRDDDPRFAVFARFGPKQELELQAAAVIQNESARIGLTNDSDFVYYTFGASYNMRPHRIAVHGAYFRDKFLGSQNGAFRGQQIDSVLIMPSWTGTIGPLRGLLQGAVTFGTADSSTVVGREYDIFNWAAAAYFDVTLGIVRPFVGIVYASGDDDSTDNDLKGFASNPQRDSGTNFAGGTLEHLDRSIGLGQRDLTSPARASLLSSNAGLRRVLGGAGNFEYGHTVGVPFNDRLANQEHAGVNTTYSNPGTFMPFAGVTIFPVKGHEINLWYLYKSMTETRMLRQAAGPGIDFDKGMYHEMAVVWEWTLSRHFDIRLSGSVLLPGEGSKDIARTVDCNVDLPGVQGCEAKDPALWGEARFRALF